MVGDCPRPRTRRRPVGDCGERLRDVAVSRGPVPREPREARGDRRGLGQPFHVAAGAEPLKRFRQQIQAGATGAEESPRALEQEPWPKRIARSREREDVGEESLG